MSSSSSFKDYILEQLRELGGVTTRSMFGGFGLYCREAFFAIISEDTLYFKTNEQTRDSYIQQNMKPFAPSATQVLKNYYEVPVDIIEAPDSLQAWAAIAIAVSKKL